MTLKIFHSSILNNVQQLKAEQVRYSVIPAIRKLTEQEIQDNYIQVKLDVQLIVEEEDDGN